MHHLFTTTKPRASFYRLVVRVHADESWREQTESDMPHLSAAEGFSTFALAALDLHGNAAEAQRWFSESAGSYFAALRFAKNAFARDTWRCLARIGSCRDFDTARRLAVAYLKTPDAVHGRDATGGPSPMPNDHFWHPTQALAHFFAKSNDFGQRGMQGLGVGEKLIARQPARMRPDGDARVAHVPHVQAQITRHAAVLPPGADGSRPADRAR